MEYPKITWNESSLEQNLKAMEDYAMAFGKQQRDYYKNNSGYKRFWAKGLRILAILAGAVAGVIPIFSQMTLKNGELYINPAWSTVFVTISITAIGIDRFFGFSSGWMRFITTELKIESKIEQLRLSIENEKFSWQGQLPTFDKAKTTLGLIVTFLNDTSEIVKDETNTWMVEFQNVLQKFNEEMNVKADASKLGGIRITIENGDKCNEGLVIHIEGQQPITFHGTSYSINNLYPKIYKISVSGAYIEATNGASVKKQLQGETLVNVSPGVVVDVSIKLA